MSTPCTYWIEDRYCADPDTLRYINGHYCRLHTPNVIHSGDTPMEPEVWHTAIARMKAYQQERATRAQNAPSRPRARRTDPRTSHDAAATVRGQTATHARLMSLLRERGPMTDEEIAAAWVDMTRIAAWPKVSPSGLRTRRAELVDEGKVVDSRLTRQTQAGRRTTVWALPNRY